MQIIKYYAAIDYYVYRSKTVPATSYFLSHQKYVSHEKNKPSKFVHHGTIRTVFIKFLFELFTLKIIYDATEVTVKKKCIGDI